MPRVKMPSKPVGTAASGPATNSPEAEAIGDEAASLIESGGEFEAMEDAEFEAFESEEIEPDLDESSTVGEQPADETETEPEQPVTEGLVKLDDLFGEEGEAVEPVNYLESLDKIAEVGGHAWSKVEDKAAKLAEIRGSESDETDNTLDDLFAAEEKCAAAELVVETLKGELKEAKEAYDDAVNDLRKLARGARQDRSRPLFDRSKSTAADGQPQLGRHADVFAAPGVTPGASTAWRSRSIAELDLGDALSERLENSGISTIGQLQDMQEQIALGREKWPKGIGAAKITKIEDAVIAWLSKNRDAGLLGGDSSSVPVTPVDDASGEAAATSEASSEPTAEPTSNTADGLPGSDDPTDVIEGEVIDAEVEHITKSWDELHEKAERTVVLRATSAEFESRFGQGMSDFQNGETHYACLAVDHEGQWNWMQGYVTAKRAAAVEQFERDADETVEVEADPMAELADL